jgi:hypothetical protein
MQLHPKKLFCAFCEHERKTFLSSKICDRPPYFGGIQLGKRWTRVNWTRVPKIRNNTFHFSIWRGNAFLNCPLNQVRNNILKIVFILLLLMSLSKLRTKQVMKHGAVLLVSYSSEMYGRYFSHVTGVNTDTKQSLVCVLSVYFEWLSFFQFSLSF